MFYMNDYDIALAYARCNSHAPMLRAVRFLDRLREETDAHSDGWAYWRLPVQAAKQLMTLIQTKGTSMTDREVTKALVPIKRFYTTHGYTAGMTWPED